jgi:hypothetical protein
MQVATMRERKTGRFLWFPYDWRRPTWARFKSRAWNPDDDRILTPKSFGWGLTINLHALLRRLGLLRRR